MSGEPTSQADGRGIRDASLRGVLALAVVILFLGLPGTWLAPLMVSTRGKEVVSQPRALQVEVKGPYDLEGIHEVPPGTSVGTFLESPGAKRQRWDRPSGVWERPMEDLTAITLMDGAEDPRVRVEPISPGRAFLLGAPLDLNRAGIRELTLLPGVGPATARKIAAERMVRGPFGSPEDLRRVRGIPVRVLEGIRPLVTAQGGKDLREIRDSRHEIRSRVE